jgi:hypothetical protein
MIRPGSSVLCLLFCLLLAVEGSKAAAQELPDSLALQNALLYRNARLASLEKYSDRARRIQQRLLRKLSRKEQRFARQLAKTDTAAYRMYKEQGLTYDSIAKYSCDTNGLARMPKPRWGVVDSIKGIQSFIDRQSAALQTAGVAIPIDLPTDAAGQQLAGVQAKLQMQDQITQLLRQRTQSLEQLGSGLSLSGLKQVQQQVYYAGEKIKNWKKLADDPDEAEAKALEYLQGTEGFAAYLKQPNTAFGGLGNKAGAADLEALGYQTKQQVSKALQDKFGSNLQQLQQGMGQQIQQYSTSLGTISGQVKKAKNTVTEAKGSIAEAKQTAAELKQAKKKLQQSGGPGFKVNPERAKPFWQRLEKQYNVQVTRATTDGLRPAMLELGASLGFKHTPRLSYGLGASASMGLGRDWQHLKFTYEGISIRGYADWQWQYGISIQAGYERAFRPANRAYVRNIDDATTPEQTNTLQSLMGGRQQIGYIGLMKRYRINKKWNGTFLAAYNLLWQRGEIRSPWMIRTGWGK